MGSLEGNVEEGRNKDAGSTIPSEIDTRTGEKDAERTPPIQSPSATHISSAHVLDEQAIESGSHKPNPTQSSHTEAIPSASVVSPIREAKHTSLSSQKDSDLTIKTYSPKGLLQQHGDACVDPPHTTQTPIVISETLTKAQEFFELEPQSTTLGTSSPKVSKPSGIDTNRMEVGDPALDVRGSSRSPREVNLNTTSEGAFNSKANEETCVGPSGSTEDYVTKGEFQTFATEVFRRLDELKSSKSPSPDVTSDTLAAHTQALSNLTSAISSLQQQISAIPSRDDVTSAINNVTFDSSFLNAISNQLASIGEQYAADLEIAGYHDLCEFKNEIRDLVNSAVIAGNGPDTGDLRRLATRREFRDMVQCLGDHVRDVTAEFLRDNATAHRSLIHFMKQTLDANADFRKALSGDIDTILHNAVQDHLTPLRKISKQFSAQVKKALSCSAEASKPQTNVQDDQDPDHPEGETQSKKAPSVKGVVISDVPAPTVAEPPINPTDKGKGKVTEVPLTEEEELRLAAKLSRASAKLVQGLSGGAKSEPIGESSKVTEESSGTFDTLLGNIKPILTHRSSEKILEDELTEDFIPEDVAENQSPRLPLPKDRKITAAEESHRWKYSKRGDVEPPFDPQYPGLPTVETRIKFAKLTQEAKDVYSESPISCIKTFGQRTLCNKEVLYTQFSVLRKDGVIYTFTDADFHRLCVFDLPFLFSHFSRCMEKGKKYADSQSRLWAVMRAQITYWSQKDFDLAYWLGQNTLYISPPNNRPLWIKDVKPNTFVEEPFFGYVYEDRDGVKRFFDHLECNKYLHKSLNFVYKELSKEVRDGKISRQLATPIFHSIERIASFRSLIRSMYLSLKKAGFDDFPNSRVKEKKRE